MDDNTKTAGDAPAYSAGELFLCGDPRFLAGGDERSIDMTYEDRPSKIDGPGLFTGNIVPDSSLPNVLRRAGQNIHSGKASYHHRPSINVFLVKNDPFPSVGVELETILRRGVDRDSLLRRTNSNWFHFEEDGSLRSVGDGYECITEPLPSRAYRDPRLWVGLQNLLVPWVYSWDTSATGLHVHVGIDRFLDLDAASAPRFLRGNSGGKLALGRYLMAFVYENLCDDALLDGVFLRTRSGYCGRCGSGSVFNWYADSSGRVSARDTVASIVRSILQLNAVSGYADRMASNLVSSGPARAMADAASVCRSSSFIPPCPSDMSGHNVELNTQHCYTFEIRRGKGTVNGTSIHRMVEFAVLVEQYVEKILTEPDMCPSPHGFREFIIGNTVSAALRDTVSKNQKG